VRPNRGRATLAAAVVLLTAGLGARHSVEEARASGGPSAPPAQAAKVFILAGQSNMGGRAQVAELDESQQRLPVNVELYDAGTRIAVADKATFGPEVTLADELSRAMPDAPLVFIKYTAGGTSLLAWAPDWTEAGAATTGNAGAGPLYQRLLEQVAAITANRETELAAVFWMQGERDARYPAAGAAYERNFAALIQRIRRDLKAPDLPFIFGQVNPPAGTYPGLAAVRAAQVRVAERVGRTTLVTTDDLTKRPDRLHYDTQGQLALGRRFAAAYLARRMEPELAALQAAEARWREAQPKTYEFALDLRCQFCGAKTPPRYRVTGETSVLLDDLTRYSRDAYSSLGTVEKMFAVIRAQLQRGPDKALIQYDDRYGYPTMVDIDRERDTFDEEVWFRVLNFRAVEFTRGM